MQQIERWGVFEASLEGKADGNPYLDYEIKGTFTSDKETKTVRGFYDENGTYRIRFMPSFEGNYHYTISGSFMNENTGETEGEFQVTPATKGNHGPVVVVDKCYLGYADGTPYYSMGTTCYAWAHQKMELQEQTLDTLKKSPFNKIRFCFFPKYYVYNYHDPITFPFQKGQGEGIDPELIKVFDEKTLVFPGMQKAVHRTDFNYFKPNPEHFARFDQRIGQLRDMGIEADMIIMHPYDTWGNVCMNKAACDAYVSYLVARYGAYRNVWWSLSNEYDFIPTKTIEDWERYAAIIVKEDAYRHMRSIHNGMVFYDFSKDWVTHCSCQRLDFYKTTEDTDELMKKFHKPVVWDEICYEGNIQLGWGNIDAEELVRRFWEGALRGGHVGHGETFLSEDNLLWWSHGGILKGESAPRIQFLLDVLKDVPGRYIKKTGGMFDELAATSSECDKEDLPFNMEMADFELHYLGLTRPKFREVFLPEDKKFRIEVIDTWNMTITDVGIHSGFTKVDLSGNRYMALRITRVE